MSELSGKFKDDEFGEVDISIETITNLIMSEEYQSTVAKLREELSKEPISDTTQKALDCFEALREFNVNQCLSKIP